MRLTAKYSCDVRYSHRDMISGSQMRSVKINSWLQLNFVLSSWFYKVHGEPSWLAPWPTH